MARTLGALTRSRRTPAVSDEPIRGWRGWALDWLAVALLLAAPWLYLWRLFAAGPDAATLPDGDFPEFYLPIRYFVARELANGVWPLWNPYLFAGSPAAPDPQHALFYPIHWYLARFADADLATFTRALLAEVPIHLGIAGAGAFWLGRELVKLRAAAFVVGLTFMFGGYLTSYPIPQMNVLQSVVWTPAMIAALQRGARSGDWRWFVVGGLALALAILAGHPHNGLMVAGLGAAWCAWLLWRQRFGWRSVAGASLFVVVGIGVGAIQWAPIVELLALTVREGRGYAFAGGGFAPRELAGVVLAGLPFTAAAAYLGVTTVALATLGALAPTRLGAEPPMFWLLALLVVLPWSLGADGFLHGMAYALAPPLRVLRNQERVVFVASLAAAVLAGYGVRALLLGSAPWLARRVATGVGGFALGLAAFGVGVSLWGLTLSEGARAATAPMSDQLWRAALFAFGGWAALMAWRGRAGPPKLAVAGLALVIATDLGSAHWRANLVDRPIAALVPPSPLVDRILADRDRPFRLASEGLLPMDGNAGSWLGISDLTGNTPLALAAWARFEREVPETRRWSMLGVRYIVTRRDIADPRLEPLGRAGEARLYRYRADQLDPPARFVTDVRVVQTEDDVWAAVANGGRDSAVALAANWTERLTVTGAPAPSVAVTVTPIDVNRLRAQVNAPTAGLVVLSEPWAPGWRAEASDGSRTYPVVRADGILRAIPVEAGRHDVLWRYDPPGLAFGQTLGWLTGVVAISVLLVDAVWRFRGRRQVQPAPAEPDA